jgi:scyllo-inositol 2-dehydrogenase (NADP+)
MKTTKTEIGCALIGYGPMFGMGSHHGRQINSVPGLKVVAACDIDPARMEAARADFPGIATYTDVDALLTDPRVDLCVVILPHNLHAPVALKLLEAGKHVILEKPMCITTDEAKAMIDLAKASNLMLTVYHNRRHDGDFLALKGAVEGGLIGQAFSVEMWGGGYSKPRGWWRDDKAICGGLFYDWGAHYLDWLLHILPPPIDSVTGVFQKLVWCEVTNEDHVQAIIRFASGAAANVQMSSIAHHGLPRWRVLGTEGALISTAGGFEFYAQHSGVGVKGMVSDAKGTHEKYYQNIAAHLLEGAELDVKPEQAARVISVIEAAEKSSKSGEAESLPCWLR